MSIRVLLVEDNESTNFLHKIVLGDAGINEVSEVLNGLDACNYLSNEKNCPDIILLDINMPVMDGWEFLRERESKGLCNSVKIAMLTSSLRPEDRKIAESYSSVIAYLEKPLTEAAVEELKLKIAV